MIKGVAICIVLLVLVASGGLGIYKSVSTTTQNTEDFRKSPDRGTLKWLARKAKSEGKNTVVISSPIVEYIGEADDPDYVLSTYSSAIAIPIDSKTMATDRAVMTWYKFKILENLKQRPAVTRLPVPSANLPLDLLPLNEDEFLTVTYGGSVNVDGVNIIVRNSDLPPFLKNKPYLLFISKSPNGVANIWAGPTGVFSVSEDDSIAPINQKGHPMEDFLKTRLGNSVRRLKQHLDEQ